MHLLKFSLTLSTILVIFRTNEVSACNRETVKKLGDNNKPVNKLKPCKETTGQAALCFACDALLDYIEFSNKIHSSEAIIAKRAMDFCLLHVINKELCEGMVAMFTPQLTEIVSRTPDGITYHDICDMFLGGGCLSDRPNPIYDWSIPVPGVPKVEKRPAIPDGTKTLKVLYLSDIHYDKQYVPGSEAVCGLPLCCRGAPAKKASTRAGFWGDARDCDSPKWLVENMMKHINETFPELDFIIWTGDLTPHNIWKQTRKEHLDYIESLTKLFQTYFPRVPVYPALGNHESVPVDQYPPPGISKKWNMDWLYDAVAKNWIQTGLPQETEKTIRYGSYYTVKAIPSSGTDPSNGGGLRIISINTNYCDNKNLWLALKSKDPAGELSWLIQRLSDAERLNESVLIIGHIPPGSNDCIKAWSQTYWKIINRFEGIIRSQIFGHVHTDHFEVFYNVSNLLQPHRAVSIAHVGPSVTPYSNLNPGFRIYELDGARGSDSTFAFTDHVTYIMNLTHANMFNETNWTKEYSAKEFFGMEDLTAASWNLVVEKLASNDTMFKKFHEYKYKMYPTEECDANCKKGLLCSLVTSQSYTPQQCDHVDFSFGQQFNYEKKEKRC